MLTKLTPNILSPQWWKKTWQELRLVYYLVREPDVPLYLKIIPIVVGLYLLSPFDLIPGFLPVVGQLDDTALLLLALKAFTRFAPDEVIARYTDKYDLNAV